jgi:xanthine dehydrogenase accessory factor
MICLNGFQPWFVELHRLLEQQPCVLVTLHQIMGSAPRESGCRMIVTRDCISGSIGGGNLEFMAIAKARELLNEGDTAFQVLLPFGLGPALNQCCGGAVNLLFERFPLGQPTWLHELVRAVEAGTPAILATALNQPVPGHVVISTTSTTAADLPDLVLQAALEMLSHSNLSNLPVQQNASLTLEHETGNWWLERIGDPLPEVMLFGAGHVGQEVAQRIRGLPFHLSWVDQRPDIFPQDAAEFARLISSDPLAAVAGAKSDSIFIVMSHSHQLDEDICHAILARDEPNWDFRWLGLIGSATKRKRFVHRLQQRGIPAESLQRLVCPIGLAGIRGKQPATIALSLLAQLMMAPIEESHN